MKWFLLSFFSIACFFLNVDAQRVPGIVIDHSPASSQIYIGSPSICILPNGDYVASHDLFGPNSTETSQAITYVFKSENKGKSWTKISEIKGQFWSNLFVHKNELYIMGTCKEYGNALIRKSIDGGMTWTEPTDSNNGLLLIGEYHTAPVPIIEHEGKLWRAMEDAMGPIKGWGKMFGAFMLSIPVDSNLLKAENWTKSNSVRYDSTYLGGHFGGWLEGNAVVTPDGEIVDILRVSYTINGDEKTAIINISDEGSVASFDNKKGFIDFPGGCKKFTIRYDTQSKQYWTLSNFVPIEFKGKNPASTRNTQALSCSKDLINWKIRHIILQNPNVSNHGFQYLDWQFDKRDIIAVSRTAFDDSEGGAHDMHDANFLTFHRIKNFRKLSQ